MNPGEFVRRLPQPRSESFRYEIRQDHENRPMAAQPTPGILSHSGRFVPRDGTEVPSLRDIAVSLSRQPRFGGHTREPWTVLDHSLFTGELAKHVTDPDPDEPFFHRHLVLAALLHDAHEAITGDVPTHFKGEELRKTQTSLDIRLMDAFFPGGWQQARKYDLFIPSLDHRALLAEALVVGPSVLQTPADVKRYFGDEPCPEDVELLRLLILDAKLGAMSFPEPKQTRFLNAVMECY